MHFCMYIYTCIQSESGGRHQGQTHRAKGSTELLDPLSFRSLCTIQCENKRCMAADPKTGAAFCGPSPNDWKLWGFYASKLSCAQSSTLLAAAIWQLSFKASRTKHWDDPSECTAAQRARIFSLSLKVCSKHFYFNLRR